MRIAIIQDYLRSGGTERQAVSLCREFEDAGASSLLVTFRPGGRLNSFARELAVNHRALTKIDFGIDFFAPGLRKALEREKPNVLLCMGENANSYAGYLQSTFPESTVVGTLRRGKPIVPRLNLWSFRRLRAVITNTHWWKSKLVEYGLDSERIHVIENGLGRRWDLIKRETARAKIREELGASASDVVLVNVASFRSGKRQERLIKTMSRLPESLDYKLWLVGDGPRLAAGRKLAESLGMEDRMHFAGYVEDPFPYLAGADIAVSMSVRDAFPNFIVEAQSISLPVVSSQYRGVSEALEDGSTGYLIPAEDDRAFIEKLLVLMSNRRDRELMGENARISAVRRFDPGRQAQQYLEIFESLVGH